MTGSSHLGMRSELSAHRRATVSRTLALENRAISWLLYSSRSIPGTGSNVGVPSRSMYWRRKAANSGSWHTS